MQLLHNPECPFFHAFPSCSLTSISSSSSSQSSSPPVIPSESSASSESSTSSSICATRSSSRASPPSIPPISSESAPPPPSSSVIPPDRSVTYVTSAPRSSSQSFPPPAVVALADAPSRRKKYLNLGRRSQARLLKQLQSLVSKTVMDSPLVAGYDESDRQRIYGECLVLLSKENEVDSKESLVPHSMEGLTISLLEEVLRQIQNRSYHAVRILSILYPYFTLKALNHVLSKRQLPKISKYFWRKSHIHLEAFGPGAVENLLYAKLDGVTNADINNAFAEEEEEGDDATVEEDMEDEDELDDEADDSVVQENGSSEKRKKKNAFTGSTPMPQGKNQIESQQRRGKKRMTAEAEIEEAEEGDDAIVVTEGEEDPLITDFFYHSVQKNGSSKKRKKRNTSIASIRKHV